MSAFANAVERDIHEQRVTDPMIDGIGPVKKQSATDLPKANTITSKKPLRWGQGTIS